MKKNTKLAYFLRGLGFGIVFVSAVVGISGNSKDTKSNETNTVTKEMTREEIIEKAKEIGMVEGVDMKVDAILDATETPETGTTPAPEKTDTAGSTEEPSSTPAGTKAPSKTNEPTKEPAATDKPVVKVVDGKKLFTVSEGQRATEVAHELAEAGLIDDEKAFHEYLKQNKYLTKIIAGEHKITVDGSYKTIAKELCDKSK